MAQASTFAIPNKTVLIAAALTALTGLSVLNDGAKARVSSYENDFELITSGAALVDDEILASSDGARRWFRIPVSSTKWAFRSAWFIDPTGSNENDGASNVTPLKTNSELWRRLGYGAETIIRQITAFNFSGNFTVADPLILSIRLTGSGNYLTFKGTVTATSSATVVAKTDLARPTLATMTGAPGVAAFVGQRVTIVENGKTFWLERVVAGDQIETSSPEILAAVPSVGLPTQTTIAAGAGNTYQTETMSRIDAMNVTIKCDDLTGPPSLNAAYVSDLDLTAAIDASGPTITAGNAQIIYQGCNLGNGFGAVDGVYIYNNCRLKSNSTIFCGTHFYLGGMVLGTGNTTTVQEGAFVAFDMDFVFQAARLRTRRRGQVLIGTLCIQNATGDAFTVETESCDIKNANIFAGAHLLYGAGNSGVGINMGAARSFQYVATKPTVTGAVGDTKIGSAAVTAWANVPFVFNTVVNVDNGAQINLAF